MDHIALLILGIFIAIIGIVNIMGNISTIHSYNRRKVREEDVPKYGRAVGWLVRMFVPSCTLSVKLFIILEICEEIADEATALKSLDLYGLIV